MKKFISIVMVCFLAFLLVGCNKENNENKENKKEEEKEVNKIEETIKALYSDDEKLVYDNGGIYKIVVYYKGNEVTGFENYREYSDENEAKTKLEETKEFYKDNANVKNVLRSGKFVVTIFNENEYKDKTVEDIQNEYVSLRPVYEK